MLHAQHTYQFGILPAFNVNTKLAENWKINFKAESRQLLREGQFREDADYQYRYVLTDLALVAATRVSVNHTLGMGYQLRLREGASIHRLIQQFAITQRFSALRLGHRLASDQSVQSGAPALVRLRYRLAAELPLSGQAVDSREAYIKLSNEYLNQFQGDDYDLEIRVVPVIGYVFTDANKLEFGLDYRVDRLFEDARRSRFWVAVNWYVIL